MNTAPPPLTEDLQELGTPINTDSTSKKHDEHTARHQGPTDGHLFHENENN